jgi:hypothetical protein
MLTKVAIVPEWVYGSFFAGELTPTAQYDVNIDKWHYIAMCTQEYMIDDRVCLDINYDKFISEGRLRSDGRGHNWIRPDPIEVSQVPAYKYTIAPGAQKRFRIRLYLTSSNNFLVGKVHIDVATDAGHALTSRPLEIIVCTP